MAKAGFGGGCHWCTEGVFQALRGVDQVDQGFVRSDAPADRPCRRDRGSLLPSQRYRPRQAQADMNVMPARARERRRPRRHGRCGRAEAVCPISVGAVSPWQLVPANFASVTGRCQIHAKPHGFRSLLCESSRKRYPALSGGLPSAASPLLPRPCCTCVGKQMERARSARIQGQS